jgi:hypothetical protein
MCAPQAEALRLILICTVSRLQGRRDAHFRMSRGASGHGAGALTLSRHMVFRLPGSSVNSMPDTAKGAITMAAERYPAQPLRRQRVAAWVALALALIVPLMVAINAVMTLARIPGAGSDIVVGSLYTIFICFVWPLPIIAIFLATLVLRDARGRNRVAWAAVALSLLTVVVVIAAAVILTNRQ